MAQLAETMPQTGIGTRRTWERAFVWAITFAFVWRLGDMFGITSLVGLRGNFSDTVIDGISWAALAIAFISAAVIFATTPRDGAGRAHRVWPYAIYWLIAAIIVAVLYVHSYGIEVYLKGVKADEYNGLQSYLAAVEDYGFDQLGKTGGILTEFFTHHGVFVGLMTLAVSAMLYVVAQIDSASARPGAVERIFVVNIVAKIAAIPMAVTAIGVFVGATLWTVYYSFTSSRMLPKAEFVGLDQYERLWAPNNSRWWQSIENLGIYAVVTMSFVLVVGFLLAVLLDQKIRFENTFRTILLYPFALSFIVTGLIWQWLLNPDLGVQHLVRSFGWESFSFDPLYNENLVIFGICIAGLWHGTGLIMCMMLAGLRGIDEEIWKAARIDGIPTWKTYLRIVIPMMRPVFVTTIVFIASGILRVYDLVVAQTSGGPGISSEVPAKYVYDYMFGAQNLGQGFAASTMMLVAVVIIVIPWAIIEFGGRKHNG